MIRIFCIFCIWIFSKVFYRHRVYGKENISKGGGMIASNHCSFLDPPLIGISSFPEAIHFLARETLFHPTPFAWLLHQLNTHPVSKGKGNINTLKIALKYIHRGKKVMIFPEGRRSISGELQEGQLGVGMLVQKARCQIFPVYVHGTFEIWNTQRKYPKLSGKTACIFGKPLEFTPSLFEGKKEAQGEIVNQIMHTIDNLKKWYLSGANGSPP